MPTHQLAMLLPTRSADRIADPLTLHDLPGLPAALRKRLADALDGRPARLPRVAGAIAAGRRPVFELARVADVRIPPSLRLPGPVAADLPQHYADLLAADGVRLAAGLDAIPAWRDATGTVWLGQDAMFLQAVEPYAGDGLVQLAVFEQGAA